MAWKLYIQLPGGITIPAPGTFKTEDDARLFYRRNQQTFQSEAGTGKPVYVETKGR